MNKTLIQDYLFQILTIIPIFFSLSRYSVLVLERHVACSAFVSPICLPDISDPHDMYENRKAVAIGWGTMDVDTGEMPEELQHVDVETMSNNNCGYYDWDMLSENMLCAGENGKDTCYGDSGGED